MTVQCALDERGRGQGAVVHRQGWQVGQAAGLLLAHWQGLSRNKARHGRGAAWIGHGLAFGAAQQQSVGLDQAQGVGHGLRIFGVGVAAHQKCTALHGVEHFHQAVGWVAQAHHTPHIQQLLQSRREHLGGCIKNASRFQAGGAVQSCGSHGRKDLLTGVPGAGGGGASAAALNVTTTTGTAGGAGLSSSINGTATTRGGGGGGSGRLDTGTGSGAGGAGGGGAGSTNGDTGGGFAGTDNTGGGGGGSGIAGSGGQGGSGIVIIAYPDTFDAITSISGLTYTQPTRAGYRVYQFTAGTGTVIF